MTVYQVNGDITPFMCIHIREAEHKLIATQLAIGIKPEDIRLQNKPFDGSRNLEVEALPVFNNKSYWIISKGNYITLKLFEVPNAPFS